MELIGEKLILLAVLFVLGFLAGVLPHVLRNRFLAPSHLRDLLVGFLNCFSAGVFFATFFMHMLPEAQEEFSLVFGGDVEYPYAELLVSLGFFFVLLVEQTVMAWYEKKKITKGDDTEFLSISPTRQPKETKKSFQSSFNSDDKPKYYSLNELNEVKSTTVFCRNELRSTTATELTSFGWEPFANEIPPNDIGTVTQLSEVHSSSSISLEKTEGGKNEEGHGHFDLNVHSPIRSFILLFALSTHALFEGMAIGFQTSASALRSLVVAVIIHKMALGFSYGISLVNSNARHRFVFSAMLLFSIMAPIGIATGSSLTYAKEANITIETAVAIMQAFASGTFVYVIFVEILPHEFAAENQERRLSKVFSLVFGFGAMAALQAMPHEE